MTKQRARYYEISPGIFSPLNDGETGPSELATPVTAGPVPVVAAVATGSLLVSSAEALIEKWRTAALYSSYRLAQAALNSCADDLRRELERANVRQPEENIPVSNAHTNTEKLSDHE